MTAPVGHGEGIPRDPFGRFAPSLVIFGLAPLIFRKLSIHKYIRDQSTMQVRMNSSQK